VWCARLGRGVGQIVTFFAYRPSSRPLGSLTPTQPGRVTNPTQGHPGPPWEAPQAECRSLRREPKQATGLAPGHATARALAQQHVPGNGCHLACIQGVPGGSSGAPVLSARDIYELGLSPLSVVVDDSNVEWQPCHCGRGSGHEQPGECSGDSHDGGWRWGAPLGRVAWSRLDPCTGSGTVLIGSIPLSTLNAQPPELKRGLMTRAQGAAVS